MITARQTNADAALAHLAAIASEADAALIDASTNLTDRLRDAVDRNLSGSILKQRTGTLRASLSGVVDHASVIGGGVTANAPYAAFQEYGFSGTETVRAHLRRQTQVFGRAIRPIDVTVRAHQRHVDYPAHSYLRSALADMASAIRQGVLAAVTEAIGT